MDRERMCIACRKMKDKRSLLRVVKTKEGEISLDFTGKKNGRGAYVCKNAECLKILKKQNSLNRAFKMNVSDEFYKQVEEAILGNRQD